MRYHIAFASIISVTLLAFAGCDASAPVDANAATRQPAAGTTSRP
jgi:hypothetical protein